MNTRGKLEGRLQSFTVAQCNDLSPSFAHLVFHILSAVMILLLPLTLLLFSWNPFVDAGSAKNGDACTVDHQRLQVGTYQFMSDCDAMTYCNATTNTCQSKGCRKDEFSFGYDNTSMDLPPRCDPGNFCPDEEDACQPVLAVGSQCQFNRDGD